MKSRTTIWVLFATVLLLAAVWISQKRSPGDAERANVRETKQRPVATEPNPTMSVAAAISRTDEKDKRRLEEEGERLVKEARSALNANDATKFWQALNEIVHRYKGNPNPLILEFTDVLEHDDPQFRIWAAGLFLLTNLKSEEAVQALRNLVHSDKALPYGPERVELLNEEFPSSDYRFRAADILALYRIEEARNDVWSLYLKTKSKELIRPLRRLNDPHIVEELKEAALKKLGSIENMKLIGEFRINEALPELRKKYQDENLKPDLRFRTLYPLWRITGEEKYFDEFAGSFVGTIPIPYLAVGGEKEREYLVGMLATEGSDTLVKAAMALHLRFNYNKPLIEILTGYFHDLQSSNWKDGTLARRLVGSIDDPELSRVAIEYESKYQTGFHDQYAVFRKNWRYPEWEESLFMD